MCIRDRSKNDKQHFKSSYIETEKSVKVQYSCGFALFHALSLAVTILLFFIVTEGAGRIVNGKQIFWGGFVSQAGKVGLESDAFARADLTFSVRRGILISAKIV